MIEIKRVTRKPVTVIRPATPRELSKYEKRNLIFTSTETKETAELNTNSDIKLVNQQIGKSN